jgi:outer membrane protein TolC
VAAQEPPGLKGEGLTLEEALDLAVERSDEVTIARAGLQRAEGDVRRATAARMPQLNASASYSRALASQFEGFGGDGGGPPRPECEGDFTPNPGSSVGERLEALETEVTCPAGFGGFDFDEVGFGSENTYTAGLSFSLPLFSGGRLAAQTRLARAGRRSAELGLTSAEAQIRLDATAAYFDAQLGEQLYAIALATEEQLAEALRLTELRAELGTQAEFEVLRARVALQNQLPVVIQRRTQRDLAADRLRLLLLLPMDTPLTLTSRLEDVAPRPVAADTSVLARAAVRQADETVRVQQAQLSIARAQRYPSLSLNSQYGQFFYGGFRPVLDRFRDDWSVGASVQMPIFTGGRIRGEVESAGAGVMEAEARKQQVVGLALLDARNTLAQLDAARATWEASQGTVEQAERAYDIAELRFSEGISTQLELTDARILLEQALANRAVAARDLHVAQTRAELLPYLPLSTGTEFGASGNAGQPGGMAPGAGAGQLPNAGTSASGASIPLGGSRVGANPAGGAGF